MKGVLSLSVALFSGGGGGSGEQGRFVHLASDGGPFGVPLGRGDAFSPLQFRHRSGGGGGRRKSGGELRKLITIFRKKTSSNLDIYMPKYCSIKIASNFCYWQKMGETVAFSARAKQSSFRFPFPLAKKGPPSLPPLWVHPCNGRVGKIEGVGKRVAKAAKDGKRMKM